MKTVAIIEDNETMRTMLVELINNKTDYRCICACSTVKEALTEVLKHKPDIALMDIRLPDGSGIACTAELTEKLPDLQVIMLTVYNNTEQIFQALKAGACGYILKRSHPNEIVEAIKEVDAGGSPMTSSIARMVVRSFRTFGKEPADDSLTAREAEILNLLTLGLSNKEIAVRINISSGTVRRHLENVFRKLHVHCRTEAATKYLRAASAGKATS